MADRGPKNPSTTFFWNDWDNDEALKACSLAAQGLWMRCLCIAARSPEPGVVMIGGFPASRTDIAPRIAAVVGQPLDVVNALIDELLTSGAAGLDRKNRIVNRRMVKAAALHKKRSEAGKNGAGVTNRKKRENDGLPQQNGGKDIGKPPGQDAATPPANGSPSSRLQDSNASTPPLEEAPPVDAARAEAETPKPASADDAGEIPPHLKRVHGSITYADTDAAFEEWSKAAYDLGIRDAGFLNGERRKALAACLSDCGLVRWKQAMAELRVAEWLRDDLDPSKPKHWVNLMNIIKPENFMGLLEGRYAERRSNDPDERSTTAALAGLAEAGSR